MPLSETIDEARRVMEICNACRYCEGFCAVFPAMERRRLFTDGDLDYLANLCHDCRGCYYACQYAPPHEFGVNVPAALSEHRNDTYRRYAWPGFLGRAFQRNGTLVALTASLAIAAVLVLATALVQPAALFGVHRGSGAFYTVVPYNVMVSVASVLALFIVLSLGIGFRRFRQGTATDLRRPADWPAVIGAARDALTMRYLGGGGDGCNDEDDAFSQRRRISHQLMLYGFLLCFAATSVAAVYDHFFGWIAPYGYTSLPVLLGTVGGIGLILGTSGLIWVKFLADPAPRLKRLLGMDVAFLALLFFTALSGLLLMSLRETAAMGTLLSIHLGFVLGLFFAMPYSKFVHAIYRFAALVQYHGER